MHAKAVNCLILGFFFGLSACAATDTVNDSTAGDVKGDESLQQKADVATSKQKLPYIEDWNEDQLSKIAPGAKLRRGRSGGYVIDGLTIKVSHDSPFSAPPGTYGNSSTSTKAVGFSGSVTPLVIDSSNRSKTPVTIKLVTYFHTDCTETVENSHSSTASSSAQKRTISLGKVEDEHIANLYIPVGDREASIPVVRSRVRGEKYFSVFAFAMIDNVGPVRVEIPNGVVSKSVCVPISVTDQPGEKRTY